MSAPSSINNQKLPIVLAYSGGLDTSFLVPWLKDNYGRPIITVTVDTGGIDAAGAKTLAERSKAYGAIAHHQIDARADYFEQVLRFLVMGNVRRGQLYPLCVGAERVMQAQQIALMARNLDRRARGLLRAGAAFPGHGQRAPRAALSALRGRRACHAGAADRAHGAQSRSTRARITSSRCCVSWSWATCAAGSFIRSAWAPSVSCRRSRSRSWRAS